MSKFLIGMIFGIVVSQIGFAKLAIYADAGVLLIKQLTINATKHW